MRLSTRRRPLNRAMSLVVSLSKVLGRMWCRALGKTIAPYGVLVKVFVVTLMMGVLFSALGTISILFLFR